jgi:hypothetical protein
VGLYSLDYDAYMRHRGMNSNDRINLYGSVAHSAQDLPENINPENLERTMRVLTGVIRSEFIAVEDRYLAGLEERRKSLERKLPFAFLRSGAENARRRNLAAAEREIEDIRKRRETRNIEGRAD